MHVFCIFVFAHFQRSCAWFTLKALYKYAHHYYDDADADDGDVIVDVVVVVAAAG